MVRLTDILEKVKSYHPAADTDLINKAYVYSSRMHEGQLRKSGDPYFIHPLSVAGIIADMKLDAASVCAALLHDVVEDTGATEKDISALFGEEVAFLVDGVTKLGKINFTSKEDQQAESFRKMLVAMARDIRVLLVKLADRLDNMRTLEHMKPEAQERIAAETLEIYAPLAGRLGIQWLKSELEDLSFSYMYPDAYIDLKKKTTKVVKDRERYIIETTHKIEKMLIERGFAVDVKGREKHLYSVYRKMRQNNCEFEQIYDYVAFRIVTESVSDCYAALGVVHSQWTPIPGRFKDYIALPKPNLYQSLHTTVIGPGHKRIEVQIRTREMDRTAENGIAAHWQYKEKTGGLDAKDAARFSWLRQMMEFQSDVQDPAEFIDSVKGDLFHEEVYVFTPKGDVKVFPRGATPIDFAYSIHSDIGHHCSGARVNAAIVPLRYQLRNGDTVDIMTSPGQQPSKDWLEFVATVKARSKVRTFVRAEERKRSVKLGRELLEREMHKRDMSFARIVKSGDLDSVIGKLRDVGSIEEMYAQIGYGKLAASEVVKELLPADASAPMPENLKPGFIERTVRRVTGKDADTSIRIADLDDVLVRFGACCSPVPGDAITGWITRGRGVTIHRRECRKAMELDPERRIAVSWSTGSKVDRPVSLRVVTANRPGILARVSAEFTERGVNISEANCRTGDDGRAVNLFQFAVSDVARLRLLMRSLQKIDGVYEVVRV
ncbi:MAG: bifunctional (p)ppGpp synthetase/guanosine-3',5'-bis(diphosphate) 3'-pyrophosphohydrolase [Sandaracinaceae bacterium]|jgi:guanosine-3',5'-bis(diphosphate) 3'-pyrophosphohydrolase|nr:bifunctional (p)ppGpp synthetase/guanosine-3',5'-bis(diphosphate) 3'-pyrophosphohydrolase [Sandaracinaceae bacterium]